MPSRRRASPLWFTAFLATLIGCTEAHVADDASSPAIDVSTIDTPTPAIDAATLDVPAIDAYAIDTPVDDGPVTLDAAVCPPRTVACDGSCVDLEHDDRACTPSGLCELAVACGPREACMEGACTCATGTVLCDGRCADVRFDPAHCGRCGDACDGDQTCIGGVCLPAGTGFTGGFGDAWTALPGEDAAVTETTCLEEFVPSSESHLYLGRGLGFSAWDLEAHTWRRETPPAFPFVEGCSLAFYGGGIFTIGSDDVMFFQPPTHEWRTAPISRLGPVGMTIADIVNVWTATATELVRASVATSAFVRVGSPVELSMPRLTFDDETGRVFFASVGSTELWSYTDGPRGELRFEAEAPAPIGSTFCSDHDGHVYVGSNTEPRRMWQYDNRSSIWTELPSLPSDTTGATNCGVWERGALYVVTQPAHVLRELALERR